MPKVTVVIPTYNCAKYLASAIDSVLGQTFQDFELIIVNDGSVDNTDSVVKPYVGKYPGKIRYLSQENKGLAATRNVAIDHSKGEYIALLDSDDCFLPNRLESGVEILSSRPDIALTHANIRYIDEEGKDMGIPERDPRHLSGRIFNELLLLKAHISLPTILVRKECFERYGKFDEHLSRLGCEDREMWLRIAKDCRFFYQDTVLACYRIRQQSMSRNLGRMREARTYVLDKYCPAVGFANKLKRRSYFFRIHKQIAGTAFQNDDFDTAVREVKNALCAFPLSLTCWKLLVKCWVKILLQKKRRGSLDEDNIGSN